MLRLIYCLSLLLCGRHVTHTHSAGEANCICDADNTTQSYIFDDELLRKLEQQVEMLKISKEVIHLRLDALAGRSLPTNGLNASSLPNIANPDHERLPHNCAEATENSHKTGLYTIQDDMVGPTPFWVSCDEDMHDGGWTVIQRRMDGSVEFNRNWVEYKHGFGKINGEYWIGLDKLHALTTRSLQELIIVMEDFDNGRRYAKYSEFAIGDENEGYALKVLGAYSGDAGDSLAGHSACKFSTMDRDNDNDQTHCAQVYLGAWWYNKCHTSNLNGKYLRGAYSQDQYAKGVVWQSFRGFNYALKFVQMMVRPKSS